MSHNYDNWERLVVAVLKREEFRKLCYCDSLSSSFSSTSSDFDARSIDQGTDKNQVVDMWTEEYEHGVYITVAAYIDGTRELKRVHFRRRIFMEHEVEVWWLKNQGKVFEKYKDRVGLAPVPQSSIYGWAAKKKFSRGSEETKSLINANALGRIKDPILETNFDEILKSANLDGPISKLEDEWVERYEYGVYVTLEHLKDWTTDINPAQLIDWPTDIKRVRISRNKFEQREAEAWWAENREKVYDRYNARAGLARFKQYEYELINEAGMFITLEDLRDGTRDVKPVLFRKKRRDWRLFRLGKPN